MHTEVFLRALFFVALLSGQAAAAGALEICPLPSAGTPWTSNCDQVLADEQDPKTKAQLLFRRAYSLNESEKYEAAVEDLSKALDLDPHNPQYLHERGYTQNALGHYQEALKDLDEQVQLQPEVPSGYDERALARERLADFQGWYEDRNKVVELKPKDGGALFGRAEARLWLGQFAQAREDVHAGMACSLPNQQQSYAKRILRNIDLWSGADVETDTPQSPPCTEDYIFSGKALAQVPLIAACTAKFFDAPGAHEKASVLTLRSTVWVMVDESETSQSSIQDAELAAALDPDNPDLHTNLGSKYLSTHHSWGAKQEFERSLAIKRTAYALGGRAQANYNLGDRKAAFDDAKASFELKPNFVCLSVLGDLAYDEKDMKSAKLYYMGMYHLGVRDDELLARLKKLGVSHPEKEK